MDPGSLDIRRLFRGPLARHQMMNLLAEQLRISALEAEATRFQRFAREAPIGILFVGSDGRVQFGNDEYLRIVGRPRDEFDAERFRREPDAVPQWVRADSGGRYEAEHVRPDGTRVPILVGVVTQQDGLAAFVLDLTAEKAAQQALRESEERYRALAEKLGYADRCKDEFFSALSHELRNPLAALQSALYLLSRSGDDAARRQRAREVMERQLGHLTRLVDDLLDVARITRGRIQLHPAPLDLVALVGETVEDHRARLEALGLTVVLELPSRPLAVEGDATRLAQVLGNLLTNSAKFTPRGGTVSVCLAGDSAAALLEVADTGEGIDAELLSRIFEPFSQADRSLARSRGGLGLGLALVKRLVELHGGAVDIASPGPGQGTTVAVRLPLAAPAPLQAGAEPPRPAAPLPARVLVVEDQPDTAETLREALELEGMRVTVSKDGADALAAVRRIRPDLVLCDIGLPGDMDGYALARAIRADIALRDLPLVALTGYAGPEDCARASEAGFDRHLGKPTGIDDLLREITSLLDHGRSS